LQPAPSPIEKKQKPKRPALPAEFPRTLIHHEPDNTHCPCGCALKRIGEDVSEKLDYTPGVFTVERHVRGKWVSLITLTSTQPDVNASRSKLAAAFEDGRPLPRTPGTADVDWDGKVLLARQGGHTCCENTLFKR
jgi:hypothetical protein